MGQTPVKYSLSEKDNRFCTEVDMAKILYVKDYIIDTITGKHYVSQREIGNEIGVDQSTVCRNPRFRRVYT
jgi:hypothetical protein